MNSFVWKVSVYRFLDAFKLVAYLFSLLFALNGLSVFQISLLLIIWSVSQLLFEVPMGVIADKYPRRNVLIAASVIIMVAFSLWLFGGFWFYALGMVLYGLRNALVSGTQEAFVYDELKSLGKESEYPKINGQLEGSMQMGFLLSAILGGIVGQISFNLAIIISIIVSFLAIIVLLSIKSVKPNHSTGEASYFKVLKQALKEIKSNSKIFSIIIFISFTFGIAASGDKYMSLIFNSLGIVTAWVGALIALEVGMFALAGYSFPYWNKLKNNYWQFVLILISGMLFIIFGLSNSVTFLPLVFIASYLGKLAMVKLDSDLQHQVSSEQRATVLSIKGLVFEIVFLLATFLFGITSSKLGIMSTITIWGGFYLLWTLLFLNRIK